MLLFDTSLMYGHEASLKYPVSLREREGGREGEREGLIEGGREGGREGDVS